MTSEPFRHSPGVFYTIAWYVESVQGVLFALIEIIPDHWAVRWARQYVIDAKDALGWVIVHLWNADTWASDTWDAIEDRLLSVDLDGLIESYAPGVWAFFQDPYNTILDHLYSFSTGGYWFLKDVSGGFDAYLKTHFYQLWALKDHPKDYILSYLWETHQELYWFALDPLGWIAYNIGDVIDEVRWFIRDPYHFVHWYLLKFDSPLAPFWADPSEWMIDHIIDWIVEAIIRDWETA